MKLFRNNSWASTQIFGRVGPNKFVLFFCVFSLLSLILAVVIRVFGYGEREDLEMWFDRNKAKGKQEEKQTKNITFCIWNLSELLDVREKLNRRAYHLQFNFGQTISYLSRDTIFPVLYSIPLGFVILVHSL